MMPHNQPYGTEGLKDFASGLKKLLRYLVGKWVIIIFIAAAGAVAGLCYSLFSKPVYKGVLNFVLENGEDSKLGGYSSIAAQFGFNIGGGGGGGVFGAGDNIIAFMKSRSMIVRTLLTADTIEGKAQLLVNRYMDFMDYHERWKDKRGLSDINFQGYAEKRNLLQDSVLNFFYENILKNNLSVEVPDKKNDVIAITVISHDELFSKFFTENLLENVGSFYVETQTKKAQENVLILRHQADSVHGLLNAALRGVAVSSDENPNPNPAFQRLKVTSEKRMVDVEMNKAILEELVKNLAISEISLRKEMPLVQVIDHPVLPLKDEKTGKLKGFLIGGICGTLFTLIFLTVRVFFKKVLGSTPINDATDITTA